MNKIQIIIAIVILSAFLCCKDTSNGSSLSTLDAAIPPGRYQVTTDMWNTGRVKMASPEVEPVLQWQVVLPDHLDFTTVFADAEGYTWYQTHTLGLDWNTITRLKSDGTEDCRVTPDVPAGTIFSQLKPAIMLMNAVICTQYYMTRDPADPSDGLWHGRLVCIDLSGEIRWISDIFEIDVRALGAWRISDETVAMPIEENSWTVISITDGEHLSVLETPGWATLLYSGPMPVGESDYITYGGYAPALGEGLSYVARLGSDGSTIWLNTFDKMYSFTPGINDDGVLVLPTRYELHAMDVDTGEILWEKEYERTYTVVGVNNDGNFLLTFDSRDSPIISLITPDGDELWNLEMPSMVRFNSCPIIYEDNSILVAHSHGFTLVDENGTIIWHVDSSDLGFDTQADLKNWAINPCPDDRIVFKVKDNTAGWERSQSRELILSFGPG